MNRAGEERPVVFPTTMRADDVRTIAVSSLDGRVGNHTLAAAPRYRGGRPLEARARIVKQTAGGTRHA